jgi:hypothetical protein
MRVYFPAGNTNITPAPPDVVAQIVAEAEKRMKAGKVPSSDITSVAPFTDRQVWG